MKFRIVWIDDSKTWVRSAYSDVEDAFTEREFTPEIMEFQDTAPAKKEILSTYADLILVDHTLPGGMRGDEFIKELRAHRCFAHVVYYSQHTENLQAITEDKHFIHVTHRDHIDSTLESVADQAYRQYKHPAFMRGLLLSEFIDLERLMEELISLSFRGEKNYFRQTIIESGGESFSLVSKQKFISRMIKRAVESNPQAKDRINDVGFTSSGFKAHIIDKRNVLAHAHPAYDSDSGKITLESSIGNVDFNGEWFHATRENIHLHKSKIRNFMEIGLQDLANGLEIIAPI